MIYITIPVHNRLNQTLSCINSIYENLKHHQFKIVLVDDGSTDNTYEYISSNYPNVDIIKGDGNLFWTGAVAKGIKHILNLSNSALDYVILMNNDVTLPSDDTLDNLIKVSQSFSRQALVAPLSVDVHDKETLITSGTKVKSWWLNITKHFFNNTKVSSVPSNRNFEVDFMTARFLLHPIEIFNIVGNYNYELLPHYGGDDEFSHRAKKYGFTPIVTTSAFVYLENTTEKNWGGLSNCLFCKKSSINIISRFHLSKKISTFYQFPSFFVVGLIKSFLVCFKGYLRS